MGSLAGCCGTASRLPGTPSLNHGDWGLTVRSLSPRPGFSQVLGRRPLDWLARERDRFALGIRTEVHR